MAPCVVTVKGVSVEGRPPTTYCWPDLTGEDLTSPRYQSSLIPEPEALWSWAVVSGAAESTDSAALAFIRALTEDARGACLRPWDWGNGHR